MKNKAYFVKLFNSKNLNAARRTVESQRNNSSNRMELKLCLDTFVEIFGSQNLTDADKEFLNAESGIQKARVPLPQREVEKSNDEGPEIKETLLNIILKLEVLDDKLETILKQHNLAANDSELEIDSETLEVTEMALKVTGDIDPDAKVEADSTRETTPRRPGRPTRAVEEARKKQAMGNGET